MLDMVQNSVPYRLSCAISEERIVEYERAALHERQARRNAGVLRAFARKFTILSPRSIHDFLRDEKNIGKSNKTL